MTLADAGEIFGYWEHSPPSHLLLQAIARLLGWTPPASSGDTAGIAQIAAMPPPGLAVTRGGDLGMPPALAADALRDRNRARAAQNAARNRATAEP